MKSLLKTHIRRLTVADALKCQELSQRVEWQLTVNEWKRYIEWSGSGAYAMVHRVSVIAATTLIFRYGTDRAWIGAVITNPRFQRQGLASQLMETALTELKRNKVREIMLDATAMGRPLYEKFGFRAAYSVDIFSTVAHPQPDPTAERYQPTYLNDILALDRQVFGADRSRVIKAMLEDYPAWVDTENGVLQGYIIGKTRDAENVHLGPWIHQHPEGAEKLLQTALHHLKERKVRIDVSERNPAGQEIVKRYGAERLRSTTRMILGDSEPTIQHDHYYAKAQFATG